MFFQQVFDAGSGIKGDQIAGFDLDARTKTRVDGVKIISGRQLWAANKVEAFPSAASFSAIKIKASATSSFSTKGRP